MDSENLDRESNSQVKMVLHLSVASEQVNEVKQHPDAFLRAKSASSYT
ncbi:hypothetical protein [Nostoc sp. C117]